MEDISQLIKKRLNQHKLGATAEASEVVFRAGQHVKGWLSAEPNEVRVTMLKNSVLWIEVSHSAWAQEVQSISATLLHRLQSEYGQKMVQKVCTKSLTTK